MPRLRTEDLHPLYSKVSHDEAVAIANLGAVSYLEARDRLFEVWTAAQSEEESARAAALRAEGASAAEAALADRLAAGDAAKSRIAVLQASVDALVAERLAGAVEKERLRYELEVAAPLRQRLAALESKDETLALLRQANGLLQGKLEAAVADLEDLKEVKTKSSHAIGKAGEATVWEMIESSVIPEFPYAEAKNMSGVSHAADFHLWVMGPSGRRLKMLIYSKKYKRAVNSDEINKLVADVDADEEAHAGMMVSLASPICTTKQFQVRASDKGKPILYVSFCDIDTELHKEILCWAVRTLISAVHEDREETSMEVERVEEVLTDICTSLKEVDGMVKMHQKMIEGLRGMKSGILQKISDFRGEPEDVISHDGGCVTVVKSTGTRCGKPVFNNGAKCRHHTSRKEKAAES